MRTGVYARGKLLVAQALFGRLITQRGTLRGGDEESRYGFDISSYVGAVGTDVALMALPSQVEGELSKDPRVASVICVADSETRPDKSVRIILTITVTLQDESGSFDLTVGVDSVSAELLDIAA